MTDAHTRKKPRPQGGGGAPHTQRTHTTGTDDHTHPPLMHTTAGQSWRAARGLLGHIHDRRLLRRRGRCTGGGQWGILVC